MPWSEEWRSENRPDPERIPDEYSLSSNLAENWMVGYFAGVIGFSYVSLRLIGSEAILLGGVPILVWLLIGISTLVVIGLYVSYSRSNVTVEDQSIQSSTVSENE